MLNVLRFSFCRNRIGGTTLLSQRKNVAEHVRAKFCWNCRLFRETGHQKVSLRRLMSKDAELPLQQQHKQQQYQNWKERKKDAHLKDLTKVLENRQNQLQGESQKSGQLNSTSTKNVSPEVKASSPAEQADPSHGKSMRRKSSKNKLKDPKRESVSATSSEAANNKRLKSTKQNKTDATSRELVTSSHTVVSTKVKKLKTAAQVFPRPSPYEVQDRRIIDYLHKNSSFLGYATQDFEHDVDTLADVNYFSNSITDDYVASSPEPEVTYSNDDTIWTPSASDISGLSSLYGSKSKKKKRTSKPISPDRPSAFIKHPNVGLVQELENVLTHHQMAPKMQRHLEDLIKDLRLRLGMVHEEGKAKTRGRKTVTHPGVQFWKPEELTDFDEIKVASQVVRVLNEEMSKSKAQAMYRDQHEQHQIKLYNRQVLVYVEACVHCSMLSKAQWLLAPKLGGNSKKKMRTRDVVDVTIFNALIRVWAKQGNLHMVQKLFAGMEMRGIQPDLLSYALTLQCLARQTLCPQHILQQVYSDIVSKGYKVEDILERCELSEDEWRLTEKCLKQLDAGYTATVPELHQPYTSNLMLNLNDGPDMPLVNPNAAALNTEELKSRVRRQMAIETKTSVTVESVVKKHTVSKQIISARKTLDEHRNVWRESLSKSFERNLATLITLGEKVNYEMDLVPFLKILPSEVYTNTLMHEIEYLAREAATFAPTLPYLQRKLGNKIYQQYVVSCRAKMGYTSKMERLFEEYIEKFNQNKMMSRNYREMWMDIVNKHNLHLTMNSKITRWPGKVILELGKHLYNIILYDTKINAHAFFTKKPVQWMPAFYLHLEQLTKDQRPERVIKPHPTLVKLYDAAQVSEMVFNSSDMPSLVPPLPWTTVNHGADLLASTELIKNSHRSEEQVETLSRLPRSQMFPLFDALNAVSSTPWKINKPVLDLVLKIFVAGGDSDLDIPPPAAALPAMPPITSEMSAEEKQQLFEERKKLKKKQQEMHSIWMTELYRFSIANKFRDEVFWFPHNVDFRGRSYAVPPYFNHLGGDLARSLIEFAVGKPLGKDGLDWLKIHCINLTGFKKRSPNVERLEFANEMMPQILDSADCPMDGERWWQSSDEPWQTLACCMEIANAVRSADPVTYICHLPVHQDGSCNGLQHYAALGRDQAGAESVNLHPFTAPKDVYSDVVELVEQERRKDAANGLEIAQILEGFIRRKVIKQTIMTTVYGVTRYGARLQIQGQLEDIKEFPQDMTFQAAQYLVKLTFRSLQEMFTATKEIQDWLTVSAELIAGVLNKPVSWETPLGFPVIQPYQRPAREKIALVKTPAGNITKYTHYQRPNMTRQKNAFPPNFIHSLDATHMMLTAVNCLRLGVTFVSVHDCYWTHAADVPTMNKVCRDQFVALHKHPVLEDLALYMQDKFCPSDNSVQVTDPITLNFVRHILGRVPNRGNFDLDKVLQSTYFFS